MPPKTASEAPKGANTRAAVAAKQEETSAASAAAPPLDSPSMAEKMDQMLATVQNLSTLPSQVADLCSRMSALELRSGRTSPSKTPPTSSISAETAPTAPAPFADAARKSSVVTQSSSTNEQPAVATAQSAATAPLSASSTASQSADKQTGPSASQSGPDALRTNPWSRWAPDVQREVRFRLGKHGLSLTQLYEDPAESAPGPAPGVGRDSSSAPSTRQLVCKHETLGLFDGDPAKLESFLSRVRAIGRKRIQGWEDAVLTAVPDALTGHAAKWHSSLTERDSDAIDSLDALCAAMRRAFPINRAQLRSLARQRRWEPEKESAMNYYYDKVLLMRQAFGDTYAETALAQDVADGLDASMRAYVRLPTEAPTLQLLQASLAEWESVWREVHAVPLLADDSSKADAPAMSRSRSEPAAPSTATPLSTPLPLPPARPPRSENRPSTATHGSPQKSSASVASLALSYDPTRIVPAANGQPRMYRRPDSTRVMRLNRNCAKCGQQHFDFEHEHLLATGQVRMLEAEPYDEVDESVVGSETFVQSF
ncbi:hypothetical protein OC842_005912 [Tilletia horrida]|uniref:Retrotransposon gag domain-containing protein n=1 Tax=Tilletia horrida TaxID=155126 RepID=A0AAN6JI60_9BASI|nr:hypothetical protein OC842_005912 [Tilletia horrida]